MWFGRKWTWRRLISMFLEGALIRLYICRIIKPSWMGKGKTTFENCTHIANQNMGILNSRICRKRLIELPFTLLAVMHLYVFMLAQLRLPIIPPRLELQLLNQHSVINGTASLLIQKKKNIWVLKLALTDSQRSICICFWHALPAWDQKLQKSSTFKYVYNHSHDIM